MGRTFLHFFLFYSTATAISKMIQLLLLIYVVQYGQAFPRQYMTGKQDPPLCQGQQAKNPFPEKCGQRVAKFKRSATDADYDYNILESSNIVGGRDAKTREFPWFVDINGCGATIIDPTTLISAAHCFVTSDRINDLVAAGTKLPLRELVHKTDVQDYCGSQIRYITSVVKHPNYCSEDDFKNRKCDAYNDHDLAIITVNRPFSYNGRVQPACLPSGGDGNLPGGTMLTVVGNGYIDGETKKRPKTLQCVQVPVIAASDCKKMYTTPGAITDNMMCAGFSQGGKDACQGDSGGPIFLLPGASVEGATLVGVVSWGVGCALARQPGVYAKINTSMDWVKKYATVMHSNEKLSENPVATENSNEKLSENPVATENSNEKRLNKKRSKNPVNGYRVTTQSNGRKPTKVPLSSGAKTYFPSSIIKMHTLLRYGIINMEFSMMSLCFILASCDSFCLLL